MTKVGLRAGYKLNLLLRILKGNFQMIFLINLGSLQIAQYKMFNKEIYEFRK